MCMVRKHLKRDIVKIALANSVQFDHLKMSHVQAGQAKLIIIEADSHTPVREIEERFYLSNATVSQL